jgi:alkanesulfonate monooxygenase SsuD/methylene tetrahydromethanopterin reductase-like flavin-dependent oxidoreductase (luciferase family)
MTGAIAGISADDKLRIGTMDFSTMVLTMYVAAEDDPEADERILGIAIEESLLAAKLGFNPWFTEHHFRGAWHSNPMQFASYIAPQISPDRYLGFGVLSTPYYHPVRLVESMNLLDQLTKGRTLYGLGSGFAGIEPAGLGVGAEYHGSGQAAADTLAVMQRLWKFRTGDEQYEFEMPTHRGTVRRRVAPGAYRKRHPTVIRTASRNAAIVRAAENGWPAFLGTFGCESPLPDQVRTYRKTLARSSHSPEVVEECLRWCTCDWLAVVVADTDAEAQERAAEAKAEHLALRNHYVARHGPLRGPVVNPKAGQSAANAYAAGGDMRETIAGNPDTVAAKVQQLVDLGINHLLVRFMGEWTGQTRYISEQSMRLFSREIIPRFESIPPLRDALALNQHEAL